MELDIQLGPSLNLGFLFGGSDDGEVAMLSRWCFCTGLKVIECRMVESENGMSTAETLANDNLKQLML